MRRLAHDRDVLQFIIHRKKRNIIPARLLHNGRDKTSSTQQMLHGMRLSITFSMFAHFGDVHLLLALDALGLLVAVDVLGETIGQIAGDDEHRR